jgi:hypothetical protein
LRESCGCCCSSLLKLWLLRVELAASPGETFSGNDPCHKMSSSNAMRKCENISEIDSYIHKFGTKSKQHQQRQNYRRSQLYLAFKRIILEVLCAILDFMVNIAVTCYSERTFPNAASQKLPARQNNIFSKSSNSFASPTKTLHSSAQYHNVLLLHHPFLPKEAETARHPIRAPQKASRVLQTCKRVQTRAKTPKRKRRFHLRLRRRGLTPRRPSR